MAAGNKPEKIFRLGLVSASVFANVREATEEQQERVVRSVQLQRRYRDAGSGDWKSSTSFDLAHLPAAIVALRLAFDHLIECESAASEATTPSEVYF